MKGVNVPTSVPTYDCHSHIFRRGLPLAPVRRYAPDYDATAEDYLAQLDANGIGHGVLVQPSFLGTDNSYMVDALNRYPQRLRGIAVVDPAIAEEELSALHESNVVGIRLNLAGLPLPDLRSAAWRRLLAWLAAHHWQVELHREVRDLPQLLDPLLDGGVDVVLDHFGRPDPALRDGDPAYQLLLKRGATGRLWVKVSGVYRLDPGHDGQPLATHLYPLLRDALGADHLVWGSDWPHTQNEKSVGFAATLAQLAATVPDPQERARVLSNAGRLFRFV